MIFQNQAIAFLHIIQFLFGFFPDMQDGDYSKAAFIGEAFSRLIGFISWLNIFIPIDYLLYLIRWFITIEISLFIMAIGMKIIRIIRG